MEEGMEPWSEFERRLRNSNAVRPVIPAGMESVSKLVERFKYVTALKVPISGGIEAVRESDFRSTY